MSPTRMEITSRLPTTPGAVISTNTILLHGNDRMQGSIGQRVLISGACVGQQCHHSLTCTISCISASANSGYLILGSQAASSYIVVAVTHDRCMMDPKASFRTDGIRSINNMKLNKTVPCSTSIFTAAHNNIRGHGANARALRQRAKCVYGS